MKFVSLKKWQIVRYSAIVIATVFLSILFSNGINESSWRMAIRFTARSSCILFLLAFIASSLHKIKTSSFSQWLVANRRYLGLSMAVSHGFHAIAIAGLAISISENMVRDNHGANLGYGFIILMTITSFPGTISILSKRGWKILHTVGMYYLWLSFTVAFSEKLAESWLLYFPFVFALILGLILRFLPTIKNKLVR